MRMQPKALTIIGWILTGQLALMLGFSASIKLLDPQAAVAPPNPDFGYAAETIFAIGFVELACLVVFLIPRTAVLGAVLLTGYLGGAVATHVRVGDLFIMPVIVGVVVWLALFLREPRVRALLPLRRPAAVNVPEPHEALVS